MQWKCIEREITKIYRKEVKAHSADLLIISRKRVWTTETNIMKLKNPIMNSWKKCFSSSKNRTEFCEIVYTFILSFFDYLLIHVSVNYVRIVGILISESCSLSWLVLDLICVSGSLRKKSIVPLDSHYQVSKIILGKYHL